jgi:hypothetical protein
LLFPLFLQQPKKYSNPMKKIFTVISVLALTFSMSCSQSPDASAGKSSDAPAIEFAELVHDFGTIMQGGDGTFEFTYKNNGKEPLIINNVRSSCGCTKPEWSAEPVKKGEKSSVKVGYNTWLVGPFTKTITVYSNASNPTVTLTIKGEVKPTEQPQQ